MGMPTELAIKNRELLLQHFTPYELREAVNIVGIDTVTASTHYVHHHYAPYHPTLRNKMINLFDSLTLPMSIALEQLAHEITNQQLDSDNVFPILFEYIP